jgi:hypothetical protein
MPRRTAKFVSAIFAGVLAGIPLATISRGATPAADDCLSAPKDQAPHGSHWYYRIDHATKRHCWYLKDEKLSQNGTANSAPSAKPVSPNPEAATQRSIADAHAELPPPAAVEQTKRSDGLAPAIAAEASTATPAAETQRSLVATRWPEQSGTGSPAVPPSTADNTTIAPSSDPDAMPAPAAATAPLAADLSPEKQSRSIQTLLLVILGALGLAGLIGSAVFRFGSLRWIGGREIQIDRRAIWEQADFERRPPPANPDRAAHIRRDDIPWELRTADDPNGRIEEMLARLARSAAN